MTQHRLLLFIAMSFCCVGCGGGGGGGGGGESSEALSSRRGAEVMPEGERKQVVDHMVGQGASRDEADAFTRALNEAQREWEAKNR